MIQAQVRAFVVGQPERPADRGAHLGRRRRPPALLQPDVVVDRHAGQLRDLLSSQARGPASRPLGQPHIGGSHLGAAVPEKRCQLCPVGSIHTPRIADSRHLEHGTGDTSLNEALPLPALACDRAGMTETYEKKIVLITGANKGIGLATAAVVARSGHTVLLGARDSERGTTAARQLAAVGLDARFVRLDVTDTETIAAAAALIDADYGHLDILVNNAGISRDRPHGPTELPVEILRETYETNVFGVVAVTNTMVPLLRKSSAGYIGNVSSSLGTVASLSDPESPLWQYANLLGYNSSKAAVNAITLIYAHTLRADGITVKAVSPGYVATDLNHHSGHLTAEEAGTHIARQILEPDTDATGVFLSENGGTNSW
jgi:NAD(P)-dependent dehydrogenase (short-subunit alcohol dehydrogenase family)